MSDGWCVPNEDAEVVKIMASALKDLGMHSIRCQVPAEGDRREENEEK
jgi:hypothetical protein